MGLTNFTTRVAKSEVFFFYILPVTYMKFFKQLDIKYEMSCINK